jgi:hypothetical protein
MKARNITGSIVFTGSNGAKCGAMRPRVFVEPAMLHQLAAAQIALPGGIHQAARRKTRFTKRVSRPRFEHEALLFSDHAHDLEALDPRGRRGQRLAAPRRVYQPRQCPVIGLQPIVEIFDLPVLNVLVQIVHLLERPNGVPVRLVLVGVEYRKRTIRAKPQSLCKKAARGMRYPAWRKHEIYRLAVLIDGPIEIAPCPATFT